MKYNANYLESPALFLEFFLVLRKITADFLKIVVFFLSERTEIWKEHSWGVTNGGKVFFFEFKGLSKKLELFFL